MLSVVSARAPKPTRGARVLPGKVLPHPLCQRTASCHGGEYSMSLVLGKLRFLQAVECGRALRSDGNCLLITNQRGRVCYGGPACLCSQGRALFKDVAANALGPGDKHLVGGHGDA